MLKQVHIEHVSQASKPQFIQVQNVAYEREGDYGVWEVVKQHNTVHIIVQNIDTHKTLLVKQVRIPMLISNPGTSGEVIECCAGIIDKYPEETDKMERAVKIALEEVREELGYDMPRYTLELIKVLNGAVGTAGTTCYTFYAEVTDDMFKGQELEPDEDIEVVEVPTEELESYMAGAVTDATTMFMTQWMLQQ